MATISKASRHGDHTLVAVDTVVCFCVFPTYPEQTFKILMTHVGYTNAKTKINPSITANNLWKLTYFLHSLCDYNELLSPDLILVSMEGAMHFGNSLPGTSFPIQISFFGSVLHGKTHRRTGLHGCQ